MMIRKLVLLGALVVAAFSAGQVSAYGMSTDEATLRARLLSCAVIREAGYRHIGVSRLPLTLSQCLALR
jgi:hypothetical protein